MELGPAAGNDARAAVMVVNAPGVAPVQSTIASAAEAEAGSSASSDNPTKSLVLEIRSFMGLLLFPVTVADSEFTHPSGALGRQSGLVAPHTQCTARDLLMSPA